MDVIDTQKLDTAILYLQRITEGRNPVNNMPADDDSIINNPNVLRCMFFVKEVMEAVKANNGYIGKKETSSKKTAKLGFPIETLSEFKYTGDKALTRLMEQLNEKIDETKYNKLSYRPIRDWLIDNGYLERVQKVEGEKAEVVPTEKGFEIGITKEFRKDPAGKVFTYVNYGQKAQEFVVSNIAQVLDGEE